MVNHDDIRAIALALPGASEKPSYGGRPSWRAGSRMFAWIRDDPEALVVWVDGADEKAAMLADEPTTFFTTPHYGGEPIVLVRLDAVDVDVVRALLTESWRLRAPSTLVKAYGDGP